MVVKTNAEEAYLKQLSCRLSEEFGYDLAATNEGYLFASRRSTPISAWQYFLVVARTDGKELTKGALEHFVDEAFNIASRRFKRSFWNVIFSWNACLVPVLLSNSAFSDDAIYYATKEHTDRKWGVYEFPTLVRVNPLKIYYPKLPDSLASAVHSPIFGRHINKVLA